MLKRNVVANAAASAPERRGTGPDDLEARELTAFIIPSNNFAKETISKGKDLFVGAGAKMGQGRAATVGGPPRLDGGRGPSR